MTITIHTILIVEDHPLYSAALVQMLQKTVGTDAPVAASTVQQGLRLASSMTNLSVILLDLHLPGVNGIEAISAFQQKCPAVPVVVVSASESRQEATMALRAGAMAFVSKAVTPELLSDVINRLMSGQLLEPEWITPHGKVAVSSLDVLTLTERQNQILALLLQGHSNKEMGLCLGLAEITIKVNVSALFRLLGVVNRTQAVLAARRLGLG